MSDAPQNENPEPDPAPRNRRSPAKLWIDAVPTWLSALAAVAAVVVSAYGITRATQGDNATPADPLASIRSISADANALTWGGTYEHVIPASHDVVLMANLDGAAHPEEWDVVIIAGLAAERRDGGGESGTWSATAPVGDVSVLQSYAVVLPKIPPGVGLQDVLQELRKYGPTSDLVIHSSEPVAGASYP